MRVSFTERELDIMAVLWARGPSTVAEVRVALEDDITHNTVQKMLSILEAKGYVAHTEEGRAHRYRPLVTRVDAGKGVFARFIDKVFAGSAEALISHFVRDRALTSEELSRIRALVDDRLRAAEERGQRPDRK